MYLVNRDKGIPVNTDNKELACYLLADRVVQKFPEGAKTIKTMYNGVGRPLRLTYTDFHKVVESAVKAGYIKKV